jgi:hypothetical protein
MRHGVFELSTRRSSWLVTSTKRSTSAIEVSRTDTVTRRSGGTSRSYTKLRPLLFEISSNTLRTGASRSSIVTVLLSAAVSCGLTLSAFTRCSSTLRRIARAERWVGLPRAPRFVRPVAPR